MKIKSKVDYDEEIRLELLEDKKLASGGTNYVNNKTVYEEYVKYHQKKLEWLEQGKGIPPLPHKIAEAIIQIANRRCNSWYKTRNYSQTWKEEMIGHAIVTATLRGHGFDPTRFKDPFTYLTQICNNAIIEQLKIERRRLYVKYKMMEDVQFQAEFDDNDETSSEDDYVNDDLGEYAADERRSYIKKFEDYYFQPKKIKSKTDESKPDSADLFG